MSFIFSKQKLKLLSMHFNQRLVVLILDVATYIYPVIKRSDYTYVENAENTRG